MFTVAFCRQFPFQFHSETIWIFNFLAGRMPLNCALTTVGTFGRESSLASLKPCLFTGTHPCPMNGRGEGAILRLQVPTAQPSGCSCPRSGYAQRSTNLVAKEMPCVSSASAVISVCTFRFRFPCELIFGVVLMFEMFSVLAWSPQFLFEIFRVFGVDVFDLEIVILPKLKV